MKSRTSLLRLVDRQGHAKQPNLAHMDTHLPQQRGLGRLLDALGQRRLIQGQREADDDAHNLHRLAAGGQAGHEGAVYLQRIERKTVQTGQQ